MRWRSRQTGFTERSREMAALDPHMPPRFVDLKREIAASYPDFEARATRAWGEIVEHLHESTKDIIDSGSDVSTSV